MAAVRKARATWQGDLLSGKGEVSAGTSQAFTALPVTWGSRTEAPGGQTSPEELVASAHASCFAMALSFGLAQAGHATAGPRCQRYCHLRPGRGRLAGYVKRLDGSWPGAWNGPSQFPSSRRRRQGRLSNLCGIKGQGGAQRRGDPGKLNSSSFLHRKADMTEEGPIPPFT